MGNNCTASCHACADPDEYDSQSPERLGLDTDGVTENFQYHDLEIFWQKIKLSIYDIIIRKCVKPLYLLPISEVWPELEKLSAGLSKKEEHIEYSRFINHF